jgi:hypothetical protein
MTRYCCLFGDYDYQLLKATTLEEANIEAKEMAFSYDIADFKIEKAVSYKEVLASLNLVGSCGYLIESIDDELYEETGNEEVSHFTNIEQLEAELSAAAKSIMLKYAKDDVEKAYCAVPLD